METNLASNKAFLPAFTDSLKELVGIKKSMKIFSPEFVSATLTFHSEFNLDEELHRVEEISLAIDKIIAIIYKPHIKVETSEIVIRSELSGALSHDSFSATLRDPKLWKNKRGKMTPQYVHNEETIDSINTYENQFISMFVDVLENDIDLLLADITPLVESLQEHFERTDKTFGQHSMFKGFAKSKAPFSPFMVSDSTTTRDILLMNTRRLEKRIKNIKGTEFYKITNNKRFNKNVIPTNILMHDPLYNFCYKMYINSYQKRSIDDKEEDLYFNYVLASFAKYFATSSLLKADNSPSLVLESRNRFYLQSLKVRKDNFSFSFRVDKENRGIECKVFYMGGKRKDIEKRKAIYYLLVSHTYTARNQKIIQGIIDKKKLYYDDVLLVTAKNAVKQFHDVINLNYYKDDGGVIIKNVLASMMMLFESMIGLYHDRCPFCGGEEIIFSGTNYVCSACKSEYSIFPQYNRDLVWLTKIGRGN